MPDLFAVNVNGIVTGTNLFQKINKKTGLPEVYEDGNVIPPKLTVEVTQYTKEHGSYKMKIKVPDYERLTEFRDGSEFNKTCMAYDWFFKGKNGVSFRIQDDIEFKKAVLTFESDKKSQKAA